MYTEEARTEVLPISLTPSMKRRLKQAAKNAHTSMSNYIYQLLRKDFDATDGSQDLVTPTEGDMG